MAILLPGPGFINVGGMWEILPTPGVGMFGIFRESVSLNIYENINPVPITAQSSVVCPGGTPFSLTQPSPEFHEALISFKCFTLNVEFLQVQSLTTQGMVH